MLIIYGNGSFVSPQDLHVQRLGTVDHGFVDGILDSPPKKKSPELFFYLGGMSYIYFVALGDTSHGRGIQKIPGE
jgi:hypothetical protein